ncbi:FAD-dependent oxidoreductase [Antarcticibacterium flavum]|uniref:Tryptophan 2-monooxygenase n=1 Tax=Antarcticibacterium flavum TaxID=2058175 RepID=A0A5B7X6P9_9FLAO|nr:MULTISPECIES: FAD-dependent oxidoreductase [Antarcticibacterium]QCY71059.1 FAD-dependent oxidoreductase [Antarcticibacterium flavum]
MRQYSEQTKQRIRAIFTEKPNKISFQNKEKLAAFGPVLKKNKVIIIGAGISGLCSAYELEKKGYNVTILEAQEDHIGGRIRTFRHGNIYSEFGAMRIPEEHDLTLKYISELGLSNKLRPFIQESKDTFAYIRGTRVNRTDEGKETLKKKFKLSERELQMSVDDIWMESVIRTLTNLSKSEKEQLYSKHLSAKNLISLDQNSLYNNLKNSNLSRAAIEFVSSIYGVTTYLETALLEHLREELEGVWLNKFWEIEGGMDIIVKKFLSAIKANLLTGAVVKKIINHEKQAEVVYSYKEQDCKLSADWVICTIPLGVLTRLEIDKAFSKDKINAIRNVNYDSSTKIITRCENRFWELNDNIFGGGSVWDGGLGHTWYPSDNNISKNINISNSESMLISSYTWGMHARRIDSIPENDINNYVKNELKKIHLKMNASELIESKRWSWDNHEWSSGAFAFFNPGDQTDLYKELVNHEKKVLLAGEHCSFSHSWIQGALESALEVCNHIVNRRNE